MTDGKVVLYGPDSHYWQRYSEGHELGFEEGYERGYDDGYADAMAAQPDPCEEPAP